MNLNPIKKNDNTDALVKALEDANAAVPGTNPTDASTQVAAVPPAPGQDLASMAMPTPAPEPDENKESMIAADPQVMGENPLLSDTKPADTPTAPTDAPKIEVPTPPQDLSVPEPSAAPQNDASDDSTPTPAADDDKPEPATEEKPADLPGGLSSDADAHLPKPADSTPAGGELDDVKKDALEALRPLIDQLDLSPSEKFEKYLMMLRASDDPSLIKPAYEAAAQIEGEKEKAQALLDVINEINYITTNDK